MALRDIGAMAMTPFRWIFNESNGRREKFLWGGDVIVRAGTVDWSFEPDSFRAIARFE